MTIDLELYLDRNSHAGEDRPDKTARNKELLAARMQIMELLPSAHLLRADLVMLDVGFAGGWGLREMLRRYDASKPHAFGITLSEAELDQVKARETTEGPLLATLTIEDMHALPKEWAGAFDLIRASHVVEHSPAPYIALSEFARILRPDGVLQIVIPNAGGYCGLHEPKPRRIGNQPGHIFSASSETLIEILRKAGLTFDSYHEVPQLCEGMLHYYHRVWMATKRGANA